MTTQTLDFEALARVLSGERRRLSEYEPAHEPVSAAGEAGDGRRLAAPPQVVVPPEWEPMVASGEAVATAGWSPSATCPNCGDTGYVWVRRLVSGPYQHPPGGRAVITWLPTAKTGPGWYVVDTAVVPCPVCTRGHDGKAAYVRRLRASCGLRAEELQFRVDFLERLARRLGRRELLEGKQAAVRVMGERVAALPNAQGLVFLYGPPGVGKSGLAMAYVAAAVNMAVPAAYVAVPDLIKARRATMNGAPDPLPGLLRAKVLVLDEVDRVGTEWERHELFTVLDARARARFSAATVLISNRTPEELESDGFGYALSRASLGEVVAMGGVDLRSVVR